MKNRKIYNILLAAVWILGGASCSLDEYNPGGSSLEALMTTQDGFKQAINNCYFGLQRSFYGKQIYIELAEAGTDLWTAKQNSNTNASYFKYAEGGSMNQNMAQSIWNSGYDGIGSCNIALALADKVIDWDSEEVKNEVIAEAHFLRALYYYNLVEIFGGVTFITAKNEGVDTAPGRTEPLEIYKNCIIPDLEFAATYLPISRPKEEGRALRKSAKAYLVKAYLTTKEYGCSDYLQAAKDLADELIRDCETGGADLDTYMYPTYDDVFADANNQNNKESMFSIACSTQYGSVNKWQNNLSWMEFYCNTYYFPAIEKTEDGIKQWGGNPEGTFMPSKYLMDLYVQSDNKLDPRYAASFKTSWKANKDFTWSEDKIKEMDREGNITTNTSLAAGDEAIRVIRPEEDDYVTLAANKLKADYMIVDTKDLYGTDGKVKMNYTRQNDGKTVLNPFYYFYPSLSKFNTTNIIVSNWSKGRYGSNASIITMRMAEIYLLAAEADVYLTGGANANKYINKVRERANASQYNGAVDIQYVLDERARELAGESVRWFDLKRTGKLTEDYLQQKNPDVGQYFRDNTHTVRPIPQSFTEIIENGVEYQNPNY